MEPVRLPLPVVEGKLRAGFPSPADDFAIKRQDLNDLLITHPLATFYWQVCWRRRRIEPYAGFTLSRLERAQTQARRRV